MFKNLKEKSRTSPLLKPFYNNRYSWLAAACTAGIMIVVYFCYDLIPFGDTTILRMDLYHQYGPLFAELYERITNFDSLIYSWTSGGGSAFLGNFFNYLSSPFLVVMLLLGHKNMPEAIAVMVLLKAALASFTFSYFLSKKNKESSPLTSAFGVLYACSGYFIAYYWNIMWIDSFYLFPLVMLGIEKLISERKLKLYTITLALTLITNYYMGYMVCIFSVLYFIYYFFSNYNFTDTYFGRLAKREKGIKGFISWGYNNLRNSRFFDNGCKFAFCSIGAGMLSAFMLLPVYFILANCSATSGTFPQEFKTYFSIFDFLANHLAYLDPTIRSSGTDVLPNVYCGILTVMLVPLYFFSNRIKLNEKIMSIGILGIMFASCYTNYLNYIWHGFHFPNDLPYRFSYMYSFILLIFAYKAIKNISEYTTRQIIGSGVATIFFIILVQEIGSKNFSETGVWICIAFIGIYCLALGILKNDKYPAIAAAALVLCSVCAEYTVANTNNYSMDQTKTNFVGDYDNFQEIKDKIDEYEGNESYRMELTSLRARMDPCWYGYNGVSTFSSMAYEKTSNMQKYIGLFGNKINSYTYNPQTPVYNAMFSVKYIYDKNSYVNSGDYYSFVDANDTFTAYENNYMLNIAYPVSDDILTWDASKGENPVKVQSEYFYLATGVDGVFNYLSTDAVEFNYNPLNVSTSDFQLRTGLESGSLSIRRASSGQKCILTTTITVQNDENIYIYLQSRNIKDISIYTPTMSRKVSVADGFILDLGQHRAGDLIDIEIELKDDTDYASVKYIPFTVNKEKFVEGYEKLKSGQLEYTAFTDTFISGNFTAEKDEVLYTSIPYDSGWNIYIDGEKASEENIVKISDALIGVKVNEGKHEISFEYNPKYFKLSQSISVMFTLLLLIAVIMKELKLLVFKNPKPNLWQRADIALNEQNSNDKNDMEITVNE